MAPRECLEAEETIVGKPVQGFKPVNLRSQELVFHYTLHSETGMSDFHRRYLWVTKKNISLGNKWFHLLLFIGVLSSFSAFPPC